MPDRPSRKPHRLKPFIYLQNGAYFITICATDMKWQFGAVVNDEIQLSALGRIVDNNIRRLDQTYDCVHVLNDVVMPNHVHLLVELLGDAPPSVSRIVRLFKSAVTKDAGMPVWQKSFYDRVIRDDNEYMLRWQYIDNNPKKWLLDEYSKRGQ